MGTPRSQQSEDYLQIKTLEMELASLKVEAHDLRLSNAMLQQLVLTSKAKVMPTIT